RGSICPSVRGRVPSLFVERPIRGIRADARRVPVSPLVLQELTSRNKRLAEIGLEHMRKPKTAQLFTSGLQDLDGNKKSGQDGRMCQREEGPLVRHGIGR